MHFQLYSQLLKLDLSNEQLLKMYHVLYDEITEEEREMAKNLIYLIEVREKIQIELKGHLFKIKNAIRDSRITNTVFDFMPHFLKLEYLARNTFINTDWKACYEKERENIKLYYETLYNQDISSNTVDILLKQKRKLESPSIHGEAH